MSNPKKTTILLTGGYGTIGKYVYDTLVKNHNVLRFRSEELDLSATKQNKQETFQDIFKCKIDLIIHMAYTKSKQKDIAITKNVIRMATGQMIIFTSSWVVEFSGQGLLMDPYTKSKLVNEELLQKYQGPAIVLRLPVVLAKDNEWVRLMSKISFERVDKMCSFIHAQQVAQFINDTLLLNGPSGCTIYNFNNLPITTISLQQAQKAISAISNEKSEKKKFSVGDFLLTCAGSMCVFGFLGRQHLLIKPKQDDNDVNGIDLLLLEYHCICPRSKKHFDNLQLEAPQLKAKKIIVTTDCNNTGFPCFGRTSSNLLSLKINTTLLDRMSINQDQKSVTVLSGVTLFNLCQYLDRQNLALETLPEYMDLTVGSSIATPIHGSHLKYKQVANLASHVCFFDFSTSQWNTTSIDKCMATYNIKSSNIFIYSVKFKIVPQFDLIKVKILLDPEYETNQDFWHFVLQNITTSDRTTLQWYPKYGKSFDKSWMQWNVYECKDHKDHKDYKDLNDGSNSKNVKPSLGIGKFMTRNNCLRRYHPIMKTLHPKVLRDKSHFIMGSWHKLGSLEYSPLAKGLLKNMEWYVEINKLLNLKMNDLSMSELVGFRRGGKNGIWIDIASTREHCDSLLGKYKGLIECHSGKYLGKS